MVLTLETASTTREKAARAGFPGAQIDAGGVGPSDREPGGRGTGGRLPGIIGDSASV